MLFRSLRTTNCSRPRIDCACEQHDALQKTTPHALREYRRNPSVSCSLPSSAPNQTLPVPAWLASVSGSLSWLSLPSRCPRRYNAASHRLKRHRWRCNSSLVRKVLFVLDQLGQAAARNADAIIADGLCLRQFGLQLFGWCGHARMIDVTPAACNHSRATGSAY